jgi:hypothetical protein
MICGAAWRNWRGSNDAQDGKRQENGVYTRILQGLSWLGLVVSVVHGASPPPGAADACRDHSRCCSCIAYNIHGCLQYHSCSLPSVHTLTLRALAAAGSAVAQLARRAYHVFGVGCTLAQRGPQRAQQLHVKAQRCTTATAELMAAAAAAVDVSAHSPSEAHSGHSSSMSRHSAAQQQQQQRQS